VVFSLPHVVFDLVTVHHFHHFNSFQISVFFSFFYVTFNIANIASSFFMPVFRAMPCRGQDSCAQLE